MKIYNVLLGALSMSLVACSDFLDKTPLVNTSVELYYSNDAEVNTSIIGIYSWLQNEAFQLAPFMLIGDDCSDDCDLGNSNSEAYSWLGDPAKQLQSFNVVATNWVSNQLWAQAWGAIGAASQAIEKINENKALLTPEKAEQYLGEAYFLRALNYFFLARQYGRMPIVDHVLNYEEYYSPRATMDETWQFVIDDLTEAAKRLPKKNEYAEEDKGRATQGAAYAMMGKVYMYWGKYQEAYDTFNLFMETQNGLYDLEPNYADAFTIEHENGIESVFEIQHSTSGTGWADSNEGSILSFYEHDADPDDNVKWHNGWSMHCPTQDLVDSYEENDPRLDATVIFPGENFDGHINYNKASSTGYQSKKWYIPYAQRSQTDVSDNPKNIIFYRYADVLLYLSEACNELNKTGEALKYLEQVRNRARTSKLNEGTLPPSGTLPEVAFSSKDQLREAIWNERRAEFACEGQRFWDLVRQGRAGKVMKAYAQKYNSIKGKNFVEGKNEIFPIPDDQVTISNGTMEQNPMY